MNNKFNSKLLLSKEDLANTYDYKYIWFLPVLIILVCVFAALSPFFKGVSFIPVFIVLCVVFIVFIVLYNFLNKKIKAETDDIFSEKELIEFNAEFSEENIKINKNGNELILEYKSILKIEEYESFYLIYTNREDCAVLPISKEIGIFTDGSDFTEFVLKKAPTKKKKVKKIHLRKQKAYISIIVLGIFAFATLMPLIYMLAYSIFDYARFGMR